MMRKRSRRVIAGAAFRSDIDPSQVVCGMGWVWPTAVLVGGLTPTAVLNRWANAHRCDHGACQSAPFASSAHVAMQKRVDAGEKSAATSPQENAAMAQKKSPGCFHPGLAFSDLCPMLLQSTWT
jgi:hypothetical protein